MPTRRCRRIKQNASLPKQCTCRRISASGWYPGHIGEHSVFIRELLPQDLKIEIEKLTIDDAMKAASFLSGVVGKAHARQMDEKTRARWAAELERHRTKNLDAVMAMGERGLADRESRNSILEHCRRYPLQSV